MEIKDTAGNVIFFYDGDFKEADLDDADLSGAMLQKADLVGVIWCGTNLSGANLKEADLYWAILFTSNLSGANLEGAQLQGADLKEVNLSEADLTNANFGLDNLGGSTQLQGANLRGAQVQGAIFDGAQYDDQTIFPESFDPEKHRMVFRIIDLSSIFLTSEATMTNYNIKNQANTETWPSLPLEEWKETYATLHMWTQIVGKIRLVQSPPVNHWWQAALYVSARGLTTTPIPYAARSFEIEFDFIDHQLRITTSEGIEKSLALVPQSVANFYKELMETLRSLGIEVEIRARPDEVPDPIPFAEDETHAAYDAEYANRFWRILVQADRVFKEFRSRFIGKCSPVHFFWGSFDLAVTRFSGRRAPEREGADSITREAYSHEVISHGFWPGSGNIQAPAFYAYAAPEPKGLPEAAIRPESAFYNPETAGFILLYDDVRQADSPDETLMDFLQSTYEAAANLAKWDRASLERDAES